MKTIVIWLGIVILVLVGGFYALNGFIYSEKQGDSVVDGGEDEEMCIQVVTDARNPETGEIETFPTPCDVPEGWDTLETDPEFFDRNGEQWTRYRNDDLGIRFEFRLSPDGYVLIEQDMEEVPSEDVVEFVTLFNRAEYKELMESDVPREGPPGISLLIFENEESLTPRAWVERESTLSNSGLVVGEISEMEFEGVPAVRYTTDGLYTNDTIVAHNNGHIYMFTGSYFDQDSKIRQDFLEMLEYVSLY